MTRRLAQGGARQGSLLAVAVAAAVVVVVACVALPVVAQAQDTPDDEAPRTLVDTGDDSLEGRLDGLVDLAGSRELRTVLGAMAFLGLGVLLVAVPLGLVRLPRRSGPPGVVRRRPPDDDRARPSDDRARPDDGPTP